MAKALPRLVPSYYRIRFGRIEEVRSHHWPRLDPRGRKRRRLRLRPRYRRS